MKTFSKSLFICSNQSWKTIFASGEARLVFEESHETQKLVAATRRRSDEADVTQAKGQKLGKQATKEIAKFDPRREKRRRAKEALAEAQPVQEEEQEEYGPHPEPPELLVPGTHVEITGPTVLRDPETGRAITMLPVGAPVEIIKKPEFEPTEREPEVGELFATVRFGKGEGAVEGKISLEDAVFVSEQRALALEAGQAKEAIVAVPQEVTPPRQAQTPQEKKEEELDPKKIYVLRPQGQRATIIAYVTDIIPLREQTGVAICTMREPNGDEKNIAVTAPYKNGRPILEHANAQQVATYMRNARNA